MCTIKSILKHTFKDRTPFAKAAVCAIVIGVADLMATGTDIYWLIGDMAVQTHAHHYPTMVGLILAEVLMAASFLYLGISLIMYSNKQERKAQKKREAKRIEREAQVSTIKHSEK